MRKIAISLTVAAMLAVGTVGSAFADSTQAKNNCKAQRDSQATCVAVVIGDIDLGGLFP